MDIFLLIIAILFALLGIIGSFLPILPGPPLSLIAVFLLQITSYGSFSVKSLILYAVITLLITIFDLFSPSWFTNRLGGSSLAVNGSLFGLIIGLIFFPPLGIIFGPIIGAFIGEYMSKRRFTNAFRIAGYSFIGFIFSTTLKFLFSFYILFKIIQSLW